MYSIIFTLFLRRKKILIPLPTFSDKIIWEDFKKGEKYALSYIYDQNIQLLYRYGKKFTNEDELIKDTIQDLFFDLIRSRPGLGETDNINYYLIVAFRRKLFRSLEKNIKKDSPSEFTPPEAQIIYSAEQELIGREDLCRREKLVRDGLTKLSPKQREILYYRFTCDFDYSQICELMSIKYDSARKQVFRALQALKECLPGNESFIFFLALHSLDSGFTE